jgi:hypothetical protein
MNNLNGAQHLQDYPMFEPIPTPLDHITTGLAESTMNLSQLDEASGITVRDSDLVVEAGPSMQLGSRRKRKMQAIQEMHSGVDHCLCGVHADPNSNAVAQCRRNGCETKWVCRIGSHIKCTKLTHKYALVPFRMHKS